MATILVIEDNDTMREGMEKILSKMGHDVFLARGGQEGLKMYEEQPVDFVLADMKMEGLSGMDVLERIRARNPEALVTIITAYGTIETAVEAMRKGAFDFLTKPFSQELFKMKVNMALDFANISQQNKRLAEMNEYLQLGEDEIVRGEIIGSSPPIKAIFEKIRKVAVTDSTVLISGESGTGKELIARAVHEQSRRASHPFIKVNCSALAEGVLESELFGHEKGAFTGAIRQKAGRFELADKGSLFLDEVGDMSAFIQLKLLRVLQEREFERVGGTRTLQVDVRIMCATNKNLLEEIRANRFREDLYYRINAFPIEVPPLRDRPDDIPELGSHFLKKLRQRTRKSVKSLTPEALEKLKRHRWPGNIRELENVLEQAMVLSEGDVISANDLPTFRDVPGIEAAPSIANTEGRPLDEILEDMERELIKNAYHKAKFVKTETARILGIKTSALYYKLEKYGLLQP